MSASWGKVVLVLCLFVSVALTVEAQPQERTSLVVELGDGPLAHFTLEIANPANFDELRSVVTDPGVIAIYQEGLTPVFGGTEDFRISSTASSIVIEFDSNITRRKDGRLIVDRIDFNGRIDPVSELRVELPEGYRLKDANPQPDETGKEYLLWYDAGFIPGVVLEKGYNRNLMVFGFFLILIILLAVRFRNKLSR